MRSACDACPGSPTRSAADERSLHYHYMTRQYFIHFHQEQNHQNLDHQLNALERGIGSQPEQVVCRERLGRLLSHYYRDVA
jgi:hypothetical protein